MIDSCSVLKIKIEIELDIQDGEIERSSYLKGFSEENCINFNKISNLFIKMIDGESKVSEIVQ